MADATLVFRVPVELQDIVINIVGQILSVKDALNSFPPHKSVDNAFSTGNTSEASTDKRNNNTYSLTPPPKEEERETEKEIVKEKEQENEEESAADFQPPSYEEVFSYMRSARSSVNPARFYNWMKSHNWTDGRGDPITDWKKKLDDWEKREAEMNPRRKQPPIQASPQTKPREDDLHMLVKMFNIQQEENK